MPASSLQSFVYIPISELEVIDASSKLKNTTSSGIDNIHPKIAKESLSVIAPLLATLINTSFETGIFPSPLKSAIVKPIFKSGDPTLVSNYRPISILPYFSKLFEKIISDKLFNYLHSFNLLYPLQFGFRTGYSTEFAMIHFLDMLTDAIDKKLSVGLSLDLSKAFDMVPHDILLAKLSYFGIRGSIHCWFASYLNNRYQRVFFNNFYSDLKGINIGVPQGSILGPLLFLLYINDLPNSCPVLHPVLYADDTNLIFFDTSLENIILTLNNELPKVSLWFNSNRLRINPDKSHAVLFTSRYYNSDNFPSPIYLDNKIIAKSSSVKFLGVIFDQNLIFNDHIHNICAKISRNLGVLFKIKRFLPAHIRLKLYYSLIYPFLTYGITLWGANYPSRLKCIFLLQKKAQIYF